MKLIAVTQRRIELPDVSEMRDSLDRRWYAFLHRCHFQVLLLPNHLPLASDLLNLHRPDGLLLTGGGEIAALGGDDSARETVEDFLLEYSVASSTPLLGICRGMQKLLDYFDVELHPVDGHVSVSQQVTINGQTHLVNSYHNYAATAENDAFTVWAKTPDGVIKAATHNQHRMSGIMWHPERMDPFRQEDIDYFKEVFA